MKDQFWIGWWSGWLPGLIGVGIGLWLTGACATKLASPEAEVKVRSSAETKTDLEGPSGPIDASDSARVSQTTIGTIQLTSGWLWGPVGLLVMVALQRDRVARWRMGGLSRIVGTLKGGPDLLVRKVAHLCDRVETKKICDAIEREIERQNRPPGPWNWWYLTRRDGPEREIARAVRRLKKGKT